MKLKKVKEEIFICHKCKIYMTMSGDDMILWQHLERAFERYHGHKKK